MCQITHFVNYRADTRSSVFNVEQFLMYALVDSDDDDVEENVTGHNLDSKTSQTSITTIPPMNELAELMDQDGSCYVDGFTIGRYNYVNVYFPDRFNVAELDLDSIGIIIIFIKFKYTFY